MLILGIESSCDETAFALVKDGVLVAQIISSQIDMHSIFGGVVPELASREHLRICDKLCEKLFIETSFSLSDVDYIAVTRGPGLLSSLLIGLAYAKGLGLALDKPLIGINHLHAHLLVTGLKEELIFPSIGFLASGGHTHIYYMQDPYNFELLGQTLDDALGEAFDKTAKLLNFPYPGGQLIEKLGLNYEPNKNLFKPPYLQNENLDFSFSGLKTAVANYIQQNMLSSASIDEIDKRKFLVGELCASFMWSAFESVLTKLDRTLKQIDKPVKALYASGGVLCNKILRLKLQQFADNKNIKLLLPEISLCTDNAAMIAYLGFLYAQKGYRHDLNLEAIPRGQKIPMDYI